MGIKYFACLQANASLRHGGIQNKQQQKIRGLRSTTAQCLISHVISFLCVKLRLKRTSLYCSYDACDDKTTLQWFYGLYNDLKFPSTRQQLKQKPNMTTTKKKMQDFEMCGDILDKFMKVRVRQNDQNWPILGLKFNVHKHSKTAVIDRCPMLI